MQKGGAWVSVCVYVCECVDVSVGVCFSVCVCYGQKDNIFLIL